MAIKSKTKKPASKSKPTAGGALKNAVGVASSLLGGKKGGGSKRRSKGPNYWANKVLVQKLKTKYNRLKYGSIR